MRRLFLFLLIFFQSDLFAQTDTLRIDVDSANADTVNRHAAISLDSLPITVDSAKRMVVGKSFLKIFSKSWFFLQKESTSSGREAVFYYLLIVLLFFAILRHAYPKYFSDLFSYFFQSTLRIQQVKEQLSQSVVPGVMYSLLYFLTAGIYLYLLAEYYSLSFHTSFFNLMFVAVGILLIIYGAKSLFLKIVGWAFDHLRAANLYLFITFLTNKVMGIALMPFVVGIAFGGADMGRFCVLISEALIISLFIYRFFRAYQPLKAEFNISVIQYASYLLAAELAPLLLIYKLLIEYL